MEHPPDGDGIMRASPYIWRYRLGEKVKRRELFDSSLFVCLAVFIWHKTNRKEKKSTAF